MPGLNSAVNAGTARILHKGSPARGKMNSTPIHPDGNASVHLQENIQVIIADPDHAARRALMLVLKHKFGVRQVLEAGDVETLIRCLADCSPELLLLDWNLSGAPAPETCCLLRKAYPALKIILLSADANDADAAQKAQVHFVHKGAAPEQLIATLTPYIQE